MHLIAMLDGERIDATKYTPDAWAVLKESEERKRMVMPLCGVRAIAKNRGPDTRFFAHYQIKNCGVEHGGETAQHLAMKEALSGIIDSVPGWRSVVEYPHPSREWIVDVAAIPDDPRRPRVAFEVQLSPQAPEKYFARSQRYFGSGLFPVWLIPRQLEYHETKVPVVVTGFGTASRIPENVNDLLGLPAGQNFVTCEETLGSFVAALLRRGPSWTLGSPNEQAARREVEAKREAARAEFERKKLEAIEQSIAEMNDGSASPESAFGHHLVSTDTQTFVWGSLTSCWKCEEPMLVWDAHSPEYRKRWARVPDVSVKSDVGEKRFENHPEVHRVVDKWIKTAKADIPKASIRQRRTKTSGKLYSAFVCPSCDSVMGQFFISRIRPEKWSILSGPTVEPPASAPAAAVPPAPSPFRQVAVTNAHPDARACDWCGKDPHPEYECLWRRLRGGGSDKHYSDGVYARISSRALSEAEGTAALKRMLDRVAPKRRS